MSLNDIWRNVTEELGFYTKDTFDYVPSVPGIYAWFYPLIITSREDPIKFIQEVNTILNYDSLTRDLPIQNARLEFAWKNIHLNIMLNYKDPTMGKFLEIWDMASSDEEYFDLLRRSVLKASIFMPPLYVGKAKSLYRRCQQHLLGRDDENNFHRRFTTFARKNSVVFDKVSDLIFVCIRTEKEEKSTNDKNVDDIEGLVEEVIKYLAKPLYSIK